MSLKDFFGKTNVSEWTCENVINYYWENVSQYATLKRILYDINSELKQIKQVDSDTLRGRTARSIINDWKVRFVVSVMS